MEELTAEPGEHVGVQGEQAQAAGLGRRNTGRSSSSRSRQVEGMGRLTDGSIGGLTGKLGNTRSRAARINRTSGLLRINAGS